MTLTSKKPSASLRLGASCDENRVGSGGLSLILLRSFTTKDTKDTKERREKASLFELFVLVVLFVVN